MAPVAPIKQAGCRRLCLKPLCGCWPFAGLERPEPPMSLPRTVANVIRDHVTLELECIDRMYLNVYQPSLQLEQHVFQFLRQQRGAGAVSSRFFQAMTQTFVRSIETFAEEHKVPLIPFEKKDRKDDVAAEFRARF